MLGKKKNKDSKSAPSRNGTLFLQVTEINFNGQVDGNFRPLLQLTFGSEQVESQPNRDAKNPRFKQNFSFNVTNLDESLKIKVYNNVSKSNNIMAQVKLPIKHLDHERQLTENFEFDSKSPNPGVLTMSWRFEAAPHSPRTIYDERPVVGNLILTILSAKGLKPRQGGGGRDARCVVTYETQKYESNIVPNSVNPVWPTNQTRYIIKVRDFIPPVVIRVVDWDERNLKRFHLGSVTLLISQLVKNTEAVEKSFQLGQEPEDALFENHVGGQLTVNVQYNHTAEYRPKNLPQAAPQHICVNLLVTNKTAYSPDQTPQRPQPITSFNAGAKSSHGGNRHATVLDGPLDHNSYADHTSSDPRQDRIQRPSQGSRGVVRSDQFQQSPSQHHQDPFGNDQNENYYSPQNSDPFGSSQQSQDPFGSYDNNHSHMGMNKSDGRFSSAVVGQTSGPVCEEPNITHPDTISSNDTLRDPETFHDVLFKVIVIGNSAVGKTNLLSRWCDNQFRDTTSTVGFEFKTKSFEVDGKVVKIQLWDTGFLEGVVEMIRTGQEKFRAVTQSYYRNSSGAILVYDITSAESYQGLGGWLELLQSAPGNENLKIMLVGNKCDIEEERQVPTESGLRWARERGLFFLETSAKDNINVQKAFQQLLMEIYRDSSRPGVYNPPQTGGGGGWGGLGGFSNNVNTQTILNGINVISEGGNPSGDGKCCMDSIFDDGWD